MGNYCRQQGPSPRLGKTRNYTSELFCQEQDVVAHTRHPKLRRQRQEDPKFKVIFTYTMSLRVAWPYKQFPLKTPDPLKTKTMKELLFHETKNLEQFSTKLHAWLIEDQPRI